MTNYECDKMLKLVKAQKELGIELKAFMEMILDSYSKDEEKKKFAIEFTIETFKKLLNVEQYNQINFVGLDNHTHTLALNYFSIDELINEEAVLENLTFK